MAGRAEVVAADQRDVRLIEQERGETVAVGDRLVAEAAAEQFRNVGEGIKRALRDVGQLEARDAADAFDHQGVAIAKRFEHRLELVLWTGQSLDTGDLRDGIWIAAVLALQAAGGSDRFPGTGGKSDPPAG